MSADIDLPSGCQTVYAFDFDGVICDSVGENFGTTWRAMRVMEPELPEAPPEGLRERFIACRPGLETGFQNIPLILLLMEGVSVETMLAQFDAQVAGLLEARGWTEADMIKRFGDARVAWRDSAPEDWYGAQGFYEHTLAPVNAVASRSIIATTKQHSSACKLVTRAGLDVPLPRVYGLERLGPQKKRNVLEALIERNPEGTVHFFEDRLATLRKLTDLPRLELHLVDWGYNLPEERAQAAASADMDLLDADAFAAMLYGDAG
ncbi:MAG: hypothetical protein AAF458_24905 [Pseudomonadota bacterium]